MEQKENLVLQAPFTVSSADTDMFGRLRLSALSNFLVQSAIRSADSLGFGFSNLREEKLFWVLSRMQVEILRPLRWYEPLVVETWPKDIDGILYLRDFFVYDKDRQVAARATSGWLAIDLQSKRPKRYTGLEADRLIRLRDRHAISHPPGKLDELREGEQFEIGTRYFDIDLNGHVTSTRYIDWMMDSFPVDFHRRHYPVEYLVNHQKETMPGDSLLLRRTDCGNQTFCFEGTSLEKGTTAFRGRIRFGE